MKKKILLVSGILLVMLVMQAAGQPVLPSTTTTSSIKELTTNRFLTRQAPTPIVNETYGTTSFDAGLDVVECSTGGFALAGTTQSYGAVGSDGWLLRTDQDGVPLWNYTYGSPSSEGFDSLVECSGGGFAIAGSTQGYGVSGVAFWLVRVDADGNHLWNKTFDNSGNDQAEGLVEVSTGGFAITGYSSFGGSFNDFWLVRTDASGNHLWNETYGGSYNDLAYSLIEVSNGDFLLTGETASYGPGVPSAPSRISFPTNIWVVRTNATGYKLWDRTYHHADFGYEYGSSGVECPGGGFAIAGYARHIGTGDWDFWLIRTDDTGDHLWNETYGYSDGEEGCLNMILYSSGGFALVGWTNHTSSGTDDIWVVRTDATGNHLWNASFGSSGWDYCYGIADTSLGIALYAQADTPVSIQSWLIVIPDDVAPAWNPAPADQTVLAGLPFSYDLNATDPWTLTWVINDTTNFAIDQDGVVTNATVVLAAGIYALRVTVSDPAGNDLVGTFLVTVLAPLMIPWLLYIGIAVIAIIIVCLIIYFLRRRSK